MHQHYQLMMITANYGKLSLPLANMQTSFNNAFTASQQQQVQAHKVTINVLLDHIQSTTSINGSVVPKGGLKFCEPCVFDGKIKSVHPFLNKIESAIWWQCQALITDYDKALYLSG
jgi:hypothetical protein